MQYLFFIIILNLNILKICKNEIKLKEVLLDNLIISAVLTCLVALPGTTLLNPTSSLSLSPYILCQPQYTTANTGPPPVHILYAWRVKICKASPSSKQKLQQNIGQLSELKCIPGDMSFFLFFLLFSLLLRHMKCTSSFPFSSGYTALF